MADNKRDNVTLIRERAVRLYDGKLTPHRSCGVAMAEAFGVPTGPYRTLRRGGLTGCGECGLLAAARMILGEHLADPDPLAPTPPALGEAAEALTSGYRARLGLSPDQSLLCNDLTSGHEDFRSEARHAACAAMTGGAAELLAEVLQSQGVHLTEPQG